MRSNDTTMPPSTGMHAPESPVPAPRAVSGDSGLARELARRARPLAVVPGRTTASGRCAVAVSASSCV